jgi:hypothetical protein
MSTKSEGYGQCHNQKLTKAICNSIGVSLLTLDVEVEVLKLLGPLLMVVILQFVPHIHKLWRPKVGVDNFFLSHDIMLPL